MRSPPAALQPANATAVPLRLRNDRRKSPRSADTRPSPDFPGMMRFFRENIGHRQDADCIGGQRFIAVESLVLRCHLAGAVDELPRRVCEHGRKLASGGKPLEVVVASIRHSLIQAHTPAHLQMPVEQHTRRQRQALLLGLLGVVIFGLTLPATRVAVPDLDPLFVTLGRALLAAALAALTLLWRGRSRRSGAIGRGSPRSRSARSSASRC